MAGIGDSGRGAGRQTQGPVHQGRAHSVSRMLASIPAASERAALESLQGDLSSNLDELAAGDAPEEPVALQRWHMCHSPLLARRQLITTLQLLGELPWTTLPCEQLHGSLAAFRRWHPSYGLAVFVARASMHHVVRVISPTIT